MEDPSFKKIAREIIKVKEENPNNKSSISPLGQIKKGRWGDYRFKDDYSPSRKYDIKYEAKRSLIGKAIVKFHPKLSWENFNAEKFLMIKKQFKRWLDTRTAKQLNTIIELEDFVTSIIYHISTRIALKVGKGEPLDAKDKSEIHLVINTLLKLHKLKRKKREINEKLSFNFLR